MPQRLAARGIEHACGEVRRAIEADGELIAACVPVAGGGDVARGEDDHARRHMRAKVARDARARRRRLGHLRARL